MSEAVEEIDETVVNEDEPADVIETPEEIEQTGAGGTETNDDVSQNGVPDNVDPASSPEQPLIAVKNLIDFSDEVMLKLKEMTELAKVELGEFEVAQQTTVQLETAKPAEIEAVRAEKDDEIVQLKTGHQTELDKLQREVDTLRKENDKLKNENRRLESRDDRIDDMARAAKQMERTEKDIHRSSIKDLNNSLSDKRRYKSRIGDLEKKLVQKEGAMQSMKSDFQIDIEKLKQENDNLQKEIKNLKKEVSNKESGNSERSKKEAAENAGKNDIDEGEKEALQGNIQPEKEKVYYASKEGVMNTLNGKETEQSRVEELEKLLAAKDEEIMRFKRGEHPLNGNEYDDEDFDYNSGYPKDKIKMKKHKHKSKSKKEVHVDHIEHVDYVDHVDHVEQVHHREHRLEGSNTGTGRHETTEEKLRKTEQELEETKTRLSKIMGDKITYNNPEITDISDINRPTNLADRFRELYDNQWTDAYEVLEDKMGNREDKIIAILLTILTNIKEFCDKESKEQMQTLQRVIAQSDKMVEVGIPDGVMKYLKDCRKSTVEENMNTAYKRFQTWLETDPPPVLARYATYVKPYVEECFELCWLMVIQDPPVELSLMPQHGDRMNTKVFKAYTIDGDIVDFPVWPALLLHESGPILAQGVVQAREERSKSSKSRSRTKETKKYSHQMYEHENARESPMEYSTLSPQSATERKILSNVTDEDDYSDRGSIGSRGYRPSRSATFDGDPRKHLERVDSKTYEVKDLRREIFAEGHHTLGYSQTHKKTQFTESSYKPHYVNKYGAYSNTERHYKPNQLDIEYYFKLKRVHGDEQARRMLGPTYDKIENYFRNT